MSRFRTYRELSSLSTIEERYNYLKLRGRVGEPTFGTERWMNQTFYRSSEWRQLRDHIIVRDYGCDLGVPGYEVHDNIIIHHMNPMTVADLVNGSDEVLNPEYLISVSLSTHNAIHYGDVKKLPRQVIERQAGDTKLW